MSATVTCMTKAAGIVVDLLLLILLFVTNTTALFDMAAFYTAFAILAAAVVLKGVTYLIYRPDQLMCSTKNPDTSFCRENVRVFLFG